MPCISADVALGVEGDAESQPIVGSFAVDGMTYAVIGAGEVKLVSASAAALAGSGSASQAPAEAASGQGLANASGEAGADDGAQAALASALGAEAGNPAGASAASLAAGEPAEAGAGADGLDADEAPGAAPATMAVPASVSYDGTDYAVSAIGAYAFAGCEAATVALSASIADVDERAFRDAAVQRVEVAPANPSYLSYDGALYGADPISLLLIPGGRAGAVRILSQTEVVAPGALSHCAQVTSIDADADGAAFRSWDGLLYTADGATLVKVPAAATDITIREGCTAVAAGALAGCASLRTIHAPATVESVDPNVFEDVKAAAADGSAEADDAPAQLSSLVALEAVEGGTPGGGGDSKKIAVSQPGLSDAGAWKGDRFDVLQLSERDVLDDNPSVEQKNARPLFSDSQQDNDEAGLAQLGEGSTARLLVEDEVYDLELPYPMPNYYTKGTYVNVTDKRDYCTVDICPGADLVIYAFKSNSTHPRPAYSFSLEEIYRTVKLDGDCDTNISDKVNIDKYFGGVGNDEYGGYWGGMNVNTRAYLRDFRAVCSECSKICVVTRAVTDGWHDKVYVSLKHGDYVYDGSGTATPASVTVTWNANGGSMTTTSKVVNYGSSASAPTPPRTGYVLEGWYTAASGGTKVCGPGGSVTATANATYYAHWTAITYNVRYFDKAGNHKATDPKTYGDTFTLRGNPGWTAAGYTAQGWARSANQTSRAYTFGQSVSNLTSTQGANFDLYVAETANTYNVRYFTKSGTLIGTDPKTYDSYFNLRGDPGKTHPAYTARGWARTANQTAASHGFGLWTRNLTTSGNFDLYVAETANEYSIAYDAARGDLSGQRTSYTFESADFSLAEPTRTGYTFLGWEVSGAQGNGVAQSGTHSVVRQGTWGNLSCTAKWQANEYAVSFDPSFPEFAQGTTYEGYAPYGVSKDGGDASVVATYDVPMPSATMPKAVGYAFQGYFDDAGTCYYNADGSAARAWDKTSAATLTARWSLKTFELILDVGSGEVPDAEARGWARDEGDAGLYRLTYSIESRRIQLPSKATKPGYSTFLGWTGEGLSKPATVVIVQPYDLADKAFTGVFSGLVSYTATLDLAGGSFAEAPEGWSQEGSLWARGFDIESDPFALPTPVRAGSDFLGWALVAADGTLGQPATDVTVPKGATGDRSYRAMWQARNYSITWDYAGQTIDGKTSTASTQAYGAPIAFPARPSEADPAREHYDFAGWFTAAEGGERVEAGDYLVEGDSTFYARWEPVEYVVHLHLDGGSIEAGGEALPLAPDGHYDLPYTVEDEVALPTVGGDAAALKPVREGMEFKGWVACDEAGEAAEGAVPSLEVTVPKGSHGDFHYLATWAFAMRFEVPAAVAFRFDLADDDAFADAPYGPISTVQGEGVEFRSLSQGRLYVADLMADVTGAEPDAIVTDRSKVMLRCMGANVEDEGYGYVPLPRTSAPEGIDPSDLPALGFGAGNALSPMGKLPLRYDVRINDPLTTLAGEVDGKALASIVFTVAFA